MTRQPLGQQFWQHMAIRNGAIFTDEASVIGIKGTIEVITLMSHAIDRFTIFMRQFEELTVKRFAIRPDT